MSTTIDSTTVNGRSVDEKVRVGHGKVAYRIESFFRFTEDGEPYASLAPLKGYTHKTAPVSSLTPVTTLKETA